MAAFIRETGEIVGHSVISKSFSSTKQDCCEEAPDHVGSDWTKLKAVPDKKGGEI